MKVSWKNYIVYALLFIIINAADAPADTVTEVTCETLKCPKCCNADAKACIDDVLKCPLRPNQNFDILVTILIIIAAFAIGVPLILFIIDKLLCGRLFGC